MNDPAHAWNVSFKPLIIGFIVSALLLYGAYYVTIEHVFHGFQLMIAVMGLAAVQAFVQLVLFLHLGLEDKPQWNLLMFLFMLLIIFLIVGGSLWIMYNLNYNTMLGM